MTDWPRTIALGTFGVVTARASGPSPVTSILVDLQGDGASSVVYDLPDARSPSGASLPVWGSVAGTYRLVLEAVDVEGCVAATGLVRLVTVQ